MDPTRLPTKKALAALVWKRFGVHPSGVKVLSTALAVRGKIVARLRDLSGAYSQLGERTYTHAKEHGDWDEFDLEGDKMTIDGIHAEIVTLQNELEIATGQ